MPGIRLVEPILATAEREKVLDPVLAFISVITGKPYSKDKNPISAWNVLLPYHLWEPPAGIA